MELRICNFKRLLTSIKSLKPTCGHLLDVGCAHGWFLEAARNDFEVFGIEPDKSLFDATYRRGLSVRMGYFPDVLDDGEKFDIVVFNDVLEHIPDIERTLAFCHERLNENGLLVLNLPSSNGIFYRLSKMCCYFGYFNYFERMWQKNLPSPHVHYVNLLNLISLLKNNEFDVEINGSLLTLSLNSLYARISYTGNHSVVARAFIYFCVALVLPILKILPSDIVYVIARRSNDKNYRELNGK
jgi:SAM-dependent methyltransferase